MKTFLGAFFICLVLIGASIFFGALFGPLGLAVLTAFVAAALVSILVNALETQRKKQEELEKRIQELEGREREPGGP